MTHTLLIIIIGIVFFVLGPYLDRDRRLGTYRAAVLYGAFAAYLYFILVITILGRPAEDIPQTELVPLISWYHVIFNIDRWYYVRENMLNILLFIPLGLLAGAIWRIKAWRAFLYGLAFSLIIEVIQLTARRGYFAWDDMLHNAVGCLIGAMIVNAVRKKVESKAG